MSRARLLVAAIAAVLLALAATLLAVRASGDDTRDLLPNLDQAEPGELDGRAGTTAAGRRFFLGFASAAGNLGDGPLELAASRSSVDRPSMELVQRIRRSDDTVVTVELPSTLRYVRSPTHAHWHLLGFMRYELRSADGRRVLRDRKTGFCLGDRYQLRLELPNAESSARFPDQCGRGQPGRLKLREGISVGWGDDYKPNLEGQEFDITDLPAGRYLLVHRVNPNRVLRESDYSDNVSSLAFELFWPRGRNLPPSIGVVARCPAAATCP